MQTFLAVIITALTQLCAGFVMPAPPPPPLARGVIVAHQSLSASWAASSSNSNEPAPPVVVTTTSPAPAPTAPISSENPMKSSREVHLDTLLTGAWVNVDNPSLMLISVDQATAGNYTRVHSEWVTNHDASRVTVIGWDDGCNTGTQLLKISKEGVITGGPSTSSKVGCGSRESYDVAQRLHELLTGPSTVTRAENNTIVVTNNSTGDAMTFRQSLTPVV